MKMVFMPGSWHTACTAQPLMRSSMDATWVPQKEPMLVPLMAMRSGSISGWARIQSKTARPASIQFVAVT